ncbi:homocysteine S-methyltransferase [Streptomyces radicis]|uniref:Homocysteine S-methyltransferase n=1 Tax=Streptomyces radicis TaxID=1750517 RepID=A0A3A9W204_9ACTN|nr:homocysteine S-methyltransferase [Streptomyces radicis]RKN06879.1 homocysteine S-methyltransferase [Streptomyces radicis]RKN19497.1 homocysteine S-methyltransferase [Streptomyces radicis]
MSFPPPSGPVVLDGGLSDQLVAQGRDLGDELWTARLLVEEPEQLLAAHTAYVRAGARVVISGSYQASFEGFARRGIGRRAAARLLGDSVRLARASGARWVAASVGPYGATLADGSEYRGRYGLSAAELERFHRPRIEALLAAGPDVLALETIPDAVEAEALVRAVRGCGVPAWLSLTVAGAATRAGQPLDEAFGAAAAADEVVAVGVNCCAPADVLPAVTRATAVTGRPAVAYPNSGAWSRSARRPSSPPSLPSLAPAWLAAGARLLGGCCGVGPDTIAAMARALPAS